jgi:hypothetical protein
MNEWQLYEIRVRDFFRGIGFPADAKVRLHGARASHAIDVVIRPEVMSIRQLWIAECKCWNRKVSQQPVFALQKIAEDLGADRAFLLSEVGFQSGAREAIAHTNIVLTGLVEIQQQAEQAFFNRYILFGYRTSSFTDEGYEGPILELRLWRDDGSPIRLPITCTLVHPDGRHWTHDLRQDDLTEEGAAEIGLHHFGFAPPSSVTYRVVWRTQCRGAHGTSRLTLTEIRGRS